jgi:hypothetical protein
LFVFSFSSSTAVTDDSTDVAETTNNKIPLSIEDRQYALKISGSVEFAQKLFRTNLFAFRRDGSGSRNYIKYLGTFSVPKALSEYFPTDSFFLSELIFGF